MDFILLKLPRSTICPRVSHFNRTVIQVLISPAAHDTTNQLAKATSTYKSFTFYLKDLHTRASFRLETSHNCDSHLDQSYFTSSYFAPKVALPETKCVTKPFTSIVAATRAGDLSRAAQTVTSVHLSARGTTPYTSTQNADSAVRLDIRFQKCASPS